MISSFRLHSIYNPEREADRFIDTAITLESPSFVVVSEPGESWIAYAVQKKFPSAIIIALRYSNSYFTDSDSLWNHVWRPNSPISVSSFLFNIIPDEYLSLTQFISWKPSDSVWPEESSIVWKEISELIRKQQSIMYTRTHFGNRWLKNMFINCMQMNTIIAAEYTNKPVLLAAAGPSLEHLFPFDSSDMYVCAVSSALSCLEFNNCEPDICIATDGGYWALDHFRKISNKIPVCFPLEAAIPSFVLKTNPLILLNYGSALESLLFSRLHIQSEKAERNGTVAGTAAIYALSHSSSSVFASGLDLCPSLDFPHARPHSSESITFSTSRINALSGILYERNLSSLSFSIYRNWFSTQNEHFKNRFFRIKPVPSLLPNITDIDKKDIQRFIHISSDKSLPFKHFQDNFDLSKRKEILVSILNSLLLECRSFRDISYFISATNIHVKESKTELCLATLEFLQMVSYLDYINALKMVRKPLDDNNTITVLHSLCDAGESFITKLIFIVRSQIC